MVYYSFQLILWSQSVIVIENIGNVFGQENCLKTIINHGTSLRAAMYTC